MAPGDPLGDGQWTPGIEGGGLTNDAIGMVEGGIIDGGVTIEDGGIIVSDGDVIMEGGRFFLWRPLVEADPFSRLDSDICNKHEKYYIQLQLE